MPAPRPAARLLAVLGLLLVALSGCRGGDATTAPDETRPVVLTTFTVLADMAKAVSGGHLRVESITKVGAEVHGYEPTPGDIAKVERADLILDNGLGLEAWFAQFVDDLDVDHVVASEGITPLPIADESGHDHPNPHAWMSPVNAEIYVTNLVRAFSSLDPAHADDYRANGSTYIAQIRAVYTELRTELGRLPVHHRVLVTCEGAFSYLARDAGLTERYLWAVNAEQQATPRRVVGVIDHVRAHDVPAVFCESTVSDRAMRQVVESSDARFGGVLYVDSLSEPGGPVPTYLDLLRHDARVIIDGLTGRIGAHE